MKNIKQGYSENISAKIIIGLYVLTTGCISNGNLFSDKTIELNKPYAEWILIDEEITGKWFDIYGIVYDYFLTMDNYVLTERP
jgi:hypothetical protein